MLSTLKLFLLFLFSMFLFMQSDASSEEFTCYKKEMEHSTAFLKMGGMAEKKGDMLSALLYYQGASECIKSDKHTKKIKKILHTLVEKAEANRHLYSKGAFTTTFDKKCPQRAPTWGAEREWYLPGVPVTCKVHGKGVRMEFKENVGVFDLYEAAGFYGEADRTMVRYVKSVPENFEAFEVGYKHFRKRKKEVEKTHKISMYRGYSHIPAHNEALKEISIQYADYALEREADIFNKKSMASAEASLKELERARKWTSYLAKEEEKKVRKRAEERGDVLAKNPKEPIILQRTVEFYGVARIPAKIIKTRQRADELGHLRYKAGDWKNAAHYFQISGNRKRMRDAESRIK